jgi:type I restriction enzyme S subunit
MTLETFFEKFDHFADAPNAVAKMRELIRTLTVSGRLFGRPDASEWPAIRMKDACAQITDGEHATPHRISSGVPLGTAKNVRDGFLDLTNTDYVAQTTAEKCWKRCKPQHQDILMVCVSVTTGRVCLAQNPPDIVLVPSVALIRPKTGRIEPSLLDLFLRSSSGQSQIWGNVRQSAQPCLYLGKMAGFEITRPCRLQNPCLPR